MEGFGPSREKDENKPLAQLLAAQFAPSSGVVWRAPLWMFSAAFASLGALALVSMLSDSLSLSRSPSLSPLLFAASSSGSPAQKGAAHLPAFAYEVLCILQQGHALDQCIRGILLVNMPGHAQHALRQFPSRSATQRFTTPPLPRRLAACGSSLEGPREQLAFSHLALFPSSSLRMDLTS